MNVHIQTDRRSYHSTTMHRAVKLRYLHYWLIQKQPALNILMRLRKVTCTLCMHNDSNVFLLTWG